MAVLRLTRNILKSTKDKITAILVAGNWTNVEVRRGHKNANKTVIKPELKNALICIRMLTTTHRGLELGSTSTYRNFPLILEIFASSGTQREDLKDFIISQLKAGWIKYDYTIVGKVTTVQTANGRISVIDDIEEYEVYPDTDKATLSLDDRHKHYIGFQCKISEIET